MENVKIDETRQVSPVNTLFLVLGMQIGISILSFQRVAAQNSGYDNWVSVALMGLSTLGVMWIVLRLLHNEESYGQPELFSMQKRFFGRWIGTLLNIYVMSYQFSVIVIFMRGYIEIIQVWIFPRLGTLSFAAIFSIIIWYTVMGGFRAITGTFFLSFVYLVPLHLLNILAIGNAHFSNLLPMFEHSIGDLAQTFMKMGPCFIGFETILYFYPFIKRPQQAGKWCYFGLLTTTALYLTLSLVATVNFSPGELKTEVWPALSFWKSIHFPLVDRLEYIGIVYWLCVLIPNVSLGAWIVSRGIKISIPLIRQKYALVFVMLMITLSCALIRDRQQFDWISHWIANIGLFCMYVYIPFLLFWQWLLKKKGAKKD
ncbi:GerAB/ArcD/ProY family transporter [Sporolactobacillus pectinivorans]|uniref:GerAB/ArcD/ProY family transporter n=1 Tax=Sporolactobacillus pectinivorans TaxID=1591408 RepID=UPI0012FD0846|nr:GerAB/ArcD/ProY family transporter [Sporolactobacillus pectinivorans]